MIGGGTTDYAVAIFHASISFISGEITEEIKRFITRFETSFIPDFRHWFISIFFKEIYVRIYIFVSNLETQIKSMFMKRMILILIAAGSAMFASAQIQFGVKAGYNLTNL